MKTRVLLIIVLLVAVTASAKRRKRVHQKVEQPTEQSERIRQMTEATQRIVFIDSIVLPKTEFLTAYHLTSEAGRIAPYSTFFPKKPIKTIAYMNALDNRCIFAENDSSIYTKECLQKQWTEADTLAGINSERQFQHINYPFMMMDGTTLYFAAQGEGSIGGYDIFMTTYDAAEGRFLKPENIGMPFNSTANDYLFAIDEYNKLGFFATDRNQPDSMVCVYTFIPAEKYQPYDAERYTPEQITAFANIAQISQTWDDEQALTAALQRLQQAKISPKKTHQAFSFVINDHLTYHQLSDFKADGNLERYNQLIKLRQRYEQTQRALEKARKYYAKASPEEQATLTREILDNEQTQYELYQAIHQQEKLIRQIENTYLN